MRMIYIAGAAHSGSTLLDMMLNAHPEIISIGEVLKLNSVKYWKSGEVKGTRCSCGASGLLQCPFWIEKAHGKTLSDLNVDDYRRRDERPEPNTALFKAIAAVSGKNFIVDSSKMPRRLEYLLRQEAPNVYPVHLIRSPEGQIASVVHRFGIVGSIFRYEVVTAQTRAKLKSVPHGTVRYEDLVREPEQTLERVLAPLGLKFHPFQLHGRSSRSTVLLAITRAFRLRANS